MSSISSSESTPPRDRKRLTSSIKQSLRALSIQLSLLNHQVGARAGLNDVDLDCLDLVNRYGPLSPSALAQRASLHPATMTGILDRLERGGWVARERDPSDRRAVRVRALRDRNAELVRLYGGMNSSMSDICGSYSVSELATIADFLGRTVDAGQAATEKLGRD
jgi:DNA-binding MarR family transcriptional regulator